MPGRRPVAAPPRCWWVASRLGAAARLVRGVAALAGISARIVNRYAPALPAPTLPAAAARALARFGAFRSMRVALTITASKSTVTPMPSTPAKSDSHLARMLGVDKALVSRLKKRGMPTSTLEAAQAWRHEHLNYVQRKDVNPVRDWHRHRKGTPAAARAAVDSVSHLIPLALEAAKAGQFGLVRQQLEAALAAVPARHQASVGLPLEVWDALMGKKIDAMGITPAEKARAAVAPPEDFDLPGQVFYAMAAGLALSPDGQADLAEAAALDG